MNCVAFESRLERYQVGTLPQAERREIDQHLSRCPACKALFEALQMSENQAGKVDLSDAVLARTSGSACHKCRSLLGGLLDGDLEKLDADLVFSHLTSCPDCRSLSRVMSEMAEVLPGMREITPDSSFVSDVLRSTRALRRSQPGFARILDFLGRFTERPRFSWEAAYLGALLVFGLFGTPLSPGRDASSRLLASLQSPDGLVAQARSSVQTWCEEAQVAVAASDRATRVVGQMTARTLETTQYLIEHGRKYVEQSEGSLESARKALRTRISRSSEEAGSPDKP